MKHLRLSVPLLLGLTLAGAGCGSADEPTAKPTIDLVASNSFELTLPDNTTEETVIPAIVEAGRDQLATACEAYPGASVRIFNPLALGSYEDIACSAILDGGESVGQTSESLMSGGEHIGQAQQEIGPITLVGCGLMAIGAPLFANRAICPRGTTAGDRANCDSATTFGGAGLGILCLVLPF